MRISRTLSGLLLGVVLLIAIDACTMVGPDFVPPTADVSQEWVAAQDPRVKTEPADYKNWWQVFQDPVLDKLIQTAYEQNLPLRIAGARVFEARASLGIAIGQQYPQTQQAFGSASYNRESERSPLASQQSRGVDFDYSQAGVGATAIWELDFT